MTRVLILSAIANGNSSALREHAEAFRAAGGDDVEIDVVTFRPAAPLADGEAAPLAVAPAKATKKGRAARGERLVRTATFTSDRWVMARRVRRTPAAVERIRTADVIYADLPGAVPAGWHAARANRTAFVTTSAIDAAAAISERSAR